MINHAISPSHMVYYDGIAQKGLFLLIHDRILLLIRSS